MKPLRPYAIALGLAFLGLVLAPVVTSSRRVVVSHQTAMEGPLVDLTAWKVSLPPKPVLKAQTVRIAPVPKKALELPQPPKDSVQAQIVALWPGNDSEALKVIGCETGGTFNPRLVSRTGDYGLMQLHRSTWEDDFLAWGYGAWEPNVFDIRKNLEAGWKIFSRSGYSWSPWVCKRVLS